MRKNLARVVVAMIAAAAPLAITPAAYAAGDCSIGNGITVEDGQQWSERADENGGWYDYVCQEGTPVFTGYHWENPDELPVIRAT